MTDPAPSWRDAYGRAIQETDASKLPQLIEHAETALFLRLQELAGSADHHEERAEMRDATQGLLVLKSGKLGWPGFAQQP